MSQTYRFTRKELKDQKASDFKHDDYIKVSRYIIWIRYNNEEITHYDTPALLSWVEDANTHKFIGCTPGAGRPYYIDDFLGR